MLSTIGNRIKHLRISANMTQRDLATAINMAKSAICNVENDKTLPSSDMLLKLKEFFSISIDWLLTGESEKSIPLTGTPAAAPPAEQQLPPRSTADEFVTLKDLAGLPGLPGTIQGIDKIAKRQGWEKIKSTNPGVPGRRFIYRVSDLPQDIRRILAENVNRPLNTTNTTNTTARSQVQTDDQQMLMLLFRQLKPGEQQQLISALLKHGVNKLLRLLDDDYMAVLDLEGTGLKIALLMKLLPESQRKEILAFAENGTKQATIIAHRARA